MFMTSRTRKPLASARRSARSPWLALLLFGACTVATASAGPASFYIEPSHPTLGDDVKMHYTVQAYGGIPTVDSVLVSHGARSIDVTIQMTSGGLFVAGSASGVVDLGVITPDTNSINLWIQDRAIHEVPFGTPVLMASIGFILNVAVVEFYHPGLNHYFVTSDLQEAQLLRGSPQLGWQPTGDQFFALPVDTPLVGTLQRVCRFYGSVVPGPNSHFFTADPAECAVLVQMQAITSAALPRWNLEGRVFVLAHAGHGVCPAEYPQAVRRFYNNRAMQNDSNHRYVTSATVAQQMTAAGWIDEGVVMCGAQ